MTNGIPRHRWPDDIAETVRYWRSTGVTASTVWAALGRRQGQRISWDRVVEVLARSRAKVVEPSTQL